jgi:hypothetical protein
MNQTYREKSRTNDGTPWEGFGDFLRDAVIELKDTIQVCSLCYR